MSIFYSLIFMFIFINNSYAGTVLIRKSDGFPIEYQSGDVPVSVIMANNPQYSSSDVEIKDISEREWLSLREEKIDRPAREISNQKKEEKRQKADKLKAKLGLSDKEWQDLEEVLKE